MHQMTKEAIQKILTETGHALVVEDYDDIEALDKIAAKVINQTPEDRRLLNQPFELCGILFYPLTVAKSLWYAEKCEEWGVDDVYRDAFLFWLLTLPLEDTALDAYSLKKDADRACRRLSRRLHCTREQMTEVFEKCIGKKAGEAANDGGGDANYGALVAILLREYGGTADQWLYETPIEKVRMLIDQYVARINRENDTARRSCSKKGKAVAPQVTAKIVALSEFSAKTNQIKNRWAENGR